VLFHSSHHASIMPYKNVCVPIIFPLRE